MSLFQSPCTNLISASFHFPPWPPQLKWMCCDMLEQWQIEKLMDEVGLIDILINNAGGGGRWGLESIEDTNVDVWREVIQKNAMASAYITQRSIPHMRQR